ncbi:BUD13 homolog [Gadus macrocephalus]|uniref:BUD13 homolog n=1 Tax=Gadus macrocephalus TaxID=80720 RepID=UPI0028CBA411|nr:BUD13 homolog [Gadus macrocephalus]
MAAFTASTKGNELSKAEYLKRYLSAGDDDKKSKGKVKKKRIKVPERGLKIVDDDIDWKQMVDKAAEDTEEDEEEAPVIAELIDERPEDVKRLEAFRTSDKWRTLGDDENNSTEDGEEDGDEVYEVVASPRLARRDSPDPVARKTVRHDSPEAGPLRKMCPDSPDTKSSRITRHDSPDLSPRRQGKQQKGNSRESSPGRKKPNSSSSQKRSTDSTKARNRHDSDLDQSPPRKKMQKGGNTDADQSPPRKKTLKGKHYDSDQSPPRRKSRPGSDSDQSPPRKAQNGQGSDSDQSPPRRARQGRGSDDDLSPPRRKDPTKGMLSGGQAGLVSIDILRKEQEENRRREKHNKPLEEDSRNAQTVFRDKSGKRRDLETEREEKKRVDAEIAAKAEKYAKWGKGLAQGQMYEQKIADAMVEVNKPMARQRDDEDLDRMLREQQRDGDPMAAMLRRKKERTAKVKERPRYKGPPPPPNRFNLHPGYRWDGVDRSNGFEQKRYSRQADKSALQDEAYKWSVEDM